MTVLDHVNVSAHMKATAEDLPPQGKKQGEFRRHEL